MKLLPSPRQIGITLGAPDDVKAGLLAFVTARFDSFLVDGITVRRTLRNRLAITYPGRRGGRFPHFMPTDPDWRAEFEQEVLLAYQREVGP